MVRPLLVARSAAALVVLAGCAGHGGNAVKPAAPAPSPAAVGPPAGLSAAGRREFLLGRAVAAQRGCAACHMIGSQGHAGPGPDLSGIGLRLPPGALARELRTPTAPMPSYGRIPATAFTALVAFLTGLRVPGPASGSGLRIVGVNTGR